MATVSVSSVFDARCFIVFLLMLLSLMFNQINKQDIVSKAIYIYIYMRVCVCVCARVWGGGLWHAELTGVGNRSREVVHDIN